MKVLGNVIKSASDKRTYKAIRLTNQLQCLIVSDEEAQKSSAALSVGIGSLLDPVDAQGLAHYLEHMLFMGTEKFPEQNDYMNFIAKNSGSSNAYTSQQQTNFHFEVASNAFVHTLDRFAQFFICPLMLDSSSERQLNAVHSEHSKNLQNDSWRKYQMTKHLAKAGHPYSKFSTGDKTTLSNPDLRKMLFDFYNSHYSSNLMKMVIYGKQNVDQLGQIIESQFSAIQNKNFKSYQMTEHPFDEKMFKKMIKIVPVKDKRTLQLTWILGDQSMHYRNSPSRYVSHILGHQGKGSLLSYLISQGLANSLSAGGTDSYDCYSQFEVHVSLTDKGFQNIERVIGHVLYAVETLKRQEPEKWVFEQLQHINKMKFDFMEKRQGMSFVSNLAKRMHKRSAEQILYYPYLMQKWTPELIKSYMSEMKTENLIVICENQKYEPECTDVEPIYKTKYATKDLTTIEPVTVSSFHLPQKNIFIPQDLTIHPLGTSEYPSLLKSQQTPNIEPYYKKDHRFNLPKAEVNLRFYFDGLNSVKEDVCRKLYEEMLKESLREFAYMAETAELNSEVSFSNFYTMNIKVNGFRDSFTNFMDQYVSKILDFVPFDTALFETLKQKQIKNYSNALLGNPYQLAYDSLLSSLRQGSGNLPQKKLQIIPSITFNDVKAFAQTWRQRLYSETLISGNMDEATAVSITKSIEGTMKKYSTTLRREEISTIRPVFLPLNQLSIVQEILHSKQETNCSIIVHFQYEAFQVRTKALQDLAQAFIKEPAFDYLRTKEQLGYIVMSLPDDNRGVLGMSILVQSNIKNSHELAGYVDTFVNKILKENIDKLTEEEFNVYRTSLLSTKTQKDKNLGEECGRFWAQIVKHSYLFDRKEQQTTILPTITLEEFKSFLKFLFYENVRRFEIHEIAKSVQEVNDQSRKLRIESNPSLKIYQDILGFRKKMQLYPDYYSHL